jgi:hypothetical protein
MEANVVELDRLAPGDGEAFRRMMEAFGPHAGQIFPPLRPGPEAVVEA